MSRRNAQNFKTNSVSSGGGDFAHPVLDYHYIADGIYIGTNQCCQSHFAESLLQEGIAADISLEKERVDAPFGVDFYLWLPVENQMPPTPDQMAFGVSVIETLVALGKKIYVHCRNGHGRAPTLVAAYCIRRGKTPEEAEAFLKSKRPSVHLEDAQRSALRDFFAKSRGHRQKLS